MEAYNHTIDSGIVRDILAELAQDDMDHKYFGGGLSVQFFLPRELHRVTSDIDLESDQRTTSASFHDYVLRIAKPLIERGYGVDFKKQRCTCDAIFSRDGQKMVLQIPKRSHAKYNLEKPRLEREVSNAESMVYSGGKLKLINVNDLVSRKLGRSDTFRREYSLGLPPTDMSPEEAIERANQLKETLELSNLDPQQVAKDIAYVRMMCDLADIKAVLAHTTIDEKYILEALRQYPTRNPRSLRALFDEVVK